MKVFDLHCHPTLKLLMSRQGRNFTPWHTIKIHLDNFLDNIFDSQGNLDQMHEGHNTIACVGLMGIEASLMDQFLTQLAAVLARKISIRQIRRIACEKPGCTYEELLQQEINSIFDNPKYRHKKVRFISSIDEYYAGDRDTVHLIATIEGAHALYYGKNCSSDASQILDKVKKFRRGEPVRLLSLTVGHLSSNAMSNHAYGAKIFSKKDFAPSGDGITPLGHRVIEECHADRTGEHSILIDVKHMSLKSRIQFYNTYGTGRPIIASHVGVTGCSWDTMPVRKTEDPGGKDWFKVVHNKEEGHVPGTYFHPNSINLYNEDIAEILRSGGLIGLILDERVLGYSSSWFTPFRKVKKTSTEYVSAWEGNVFFNAGSFYQGTPVNIPVTPVTTGNDDNKRKKGQPVPPGKSRKSRKAELHTLNLVNNIIHILKVGEKINIDATKHVAIGSDFDGLINTVDSCPSASRYPDFRNMLRVALEEHASEYIPDPVSFLDDFFYNNGICLLRDNFQP